MNQQLKTSLVGVALAALIIGLWAISLLVWLRIEISTDNLWWIPAAVAVQTFLYTGLFITAHDAMHGTVCPASRRLNRLIGQLSVGLYALFSYKMLRRKHHAHHAHPVSADDPDFHHRRNDHFWPWYLRFLREYVRWPQILGMALVYNILLHLMGVAALNLNLFWVLPALLSTGQLFFFGTYLPHRGPASKFRDDHRAATSEYGALASFITCYHFGYHWEHHHRPDTPWWRLPALRRRLLSASHVEVHDSSGSTHPPDDPSN
jgi:beta-carotene ketolase (CrtW type)